MYIVSMNICHNSISKRMDDRSFFKYIEGKVEAYWMYHWLIERAHDYQITKDCWVSVILEECEQVSQTKSDKYATRIIESWYNNDIFY